VAFAASGNRATFYRCYRRASDGSPRSCSRLGLGTWAIQTLGDGRVMSFSVQPALAQKLWHDERDRFLDTRYLVTGCIPDFVAMRYLEGNFAWVDKPSDGAEFYLGWYDFPMIDNTRLANGLRCAVTLSNFSPSMADVTTVCFPGEYASLKDRPYYDEVIEKLQEASR